MDDADCLEMPGQPYALALWNLIIRPPRRRYDPLRLGPKDFRLWSCPVRRLDIDLTSSRGQQLRCSHFLPDVRESGEPRPCVIYLHQNASCRLEALQLVPLFLPLGISLFCFDFAGCGESDGDYISLGWFERDDLADIVKHLRDSGHVSSIGLWGRSMGAVTALLHADRDHSIAGMVLDSPFCNLRQLAGELAQSEYLSMKVPSWLLSGALALGRMRIKLLCNFDIDELSPIEHVGNSFIPALFVHGVEDDFIAPHHSQKLYEAYTGDKELEMVAGDHNTQRDMAVTRKSVFFLVQALRYNLPPMGEGSLASVLGFDPGEVDSCVDRKVLSSRVLSEAARLLATSSPEWKGARVQEVQRVSMSCRMEGALQLCSEGAKAGYCLGLLPQATDYGGANRPPVVIFATASPKGLSVAMVVEGRHNVVGTMDASIELGVPVLLIAELVDNSNPESFFAPPQPTTLRLTLGTGNAEMNLTLSEEYKRDGFCWPVTLGDAEIFDIDLKDMMGGSSAPEVRTSTGQGRRRRKPSQLSSGSDRETRAVQNPPPEPPSHEVTSCCRQS
ncbi:Uncharacterized protein YqkD [Durusdinium trenchii]|uniref:Uncharacterized protein YqkD n=1 Tax=Durusdinium trenchii TaxID=1381693 RepID=A0ABP0KP25_9DINO